ncbi:MAG: hypothetical protein ACKOHK_05865 [Planctomycetia bacterium]
MPGPDGRPEDVVLGCGTLDGYVAKHPYFGATCGRGQTGNEHDPAGHRPAVARHGCTLQVGRWVGQPTIFPSA